MVKMTQTYSDIRMPDGAAIRGGGDALSAMNNIQSITSIDLDTFQPSPNVDGKSSHGGYCGPAVKPIALNMAQEIQSDPASALPFSGIGGIGSWRDAAEFILLGCGNVQVCTAAMHYGYRIVEDMEDGLLGWMAEKGFETIEEFQGLSLPNVREWKQLNLNYQIVARIHEDLCIGCQLCYTACWDGAHQCIHLDRTSPTPDTTRTPALVEAEPASTIPTTPIPKLDAGGVGRSSAVTPLERVPRVDEDHCVGCNLCYLVCPVEDCITMERVDNRLPFESWEERTAKGLVPPGAQEVMSTNT